MPDREDVPQRATGPEVPFPMHIVEDVMCRDCPFPMKPGWPGDLQKTFDDWQRQVLGKLGTLKANPYASLIGKHLELVEPGGPGATFKLDPTRVVITIDKDKTIKSISVDPELGPISWEG